MRTSISWLGAASMALAISSCAPVATRWDYDPDVDFSGYRTFGWMPPPEPPAAARAVWDSPFLGKRIKQAIISAMVHKGLEWTDREPDLLIAYRIDLRQKANVHVSGYPYWGAYPQGVERYQEGTLIIDLVDARSRQLVWRGWGSGEFDPANRPRAAQGYIASAVADILKHYPPYRTAPRKPPGASPSN